MDCKPCVYCGMLPGLETFEDGTCVLYCPNDEEMTVHAEYYDHALNAWNDMQDALKEVKL